MKIITTDISGQHGYFLSQFLLAKRYKVKGVLRRNSSRAQGTLESKLAGIWTVRTFREAYKLFMSNGILFYHESEVRRSEFVTMKMSK